MRYFLCLIFVMLSSSILRAQEIQITDTREFADMITALQNENWADAHRLALACLQTVPEKNQEDFVPGLLRYCVILSQSGLMNDGKISQENAIKSIKKYEHHFIVLPGHPLSKAEVAFNSIEMVDGKTDTLRVTASNIKATNIFCFEIIAMKDKWPLDDFNNNIGKMFRLSGMLKSLTVEGHILPRFRLIIDNGTYQPTE